MEGGRQKEKKERQTDRQIDRQTDRQTDRELQLENVNTKDLSLLINSDSSVKSSCTCLTAVLAIVQAYTDNET